uniref:EGF-like domain-containing protein n=1 Tax=Chromulina nebulosa TaxID=96789 RepID=A0A7S0SUR4_9STRA|mmetsp:Transcript_2360/g.2113  ORF Transcript_2360/g.2113 Transcript_2360/m.2113 type:complete len:289 (+) Transcript_2360:34-900(+)
MHLFVVIIVTLLYFVVSRCPNYCSGHGKCQLNDVCQCEVGWGADSDISDYKSHDCSKRICKSGKSWANLPDFSGNAHSTLAECSGIGICNRTTGLCNCPDNYFGNSCERKGCPNKCSGHGLCYSMSQLAHLSSSYPLVNATFSYQLDSNSSNTWDSDRLYGCVCDSSWAVGFQSGETQEAEWFGADCSLRHCPSADNPRTTNVETDCHNITASGTNIAGDIGNLCQVDCANQGICNYKTGECQCFKNFYGVYCNISDSLAGKVSNGQTIEMIEESITVIESLKGQYVG